MNAFYNRSVTHINHRGLKTRFIENTFEAFDEAANAGFEFIETDLRATSDGHIVLTHDPDLVRMGGGEDLIHTQSRLDLQKFRHTNGQKLYFLDDHLQKYSTLNWVFDIKPQSSAQVVAILLSYAKDPSIHRWINQHVKFLCWIPEDEARLRNNFSDVTFFANKKECIRIGVCHLLRANWAAGIQKGRTYSVTEKFNGIPLFSKRFVEDLTERGARSLAFLPETKSAMEAAQNAGFQEYLLDLPVHQMI